MKLISDGQTQQASKAALRAVLARLSGKAASTGDDAALQGVAGAELLRKAQPDDLVLISFTGHGFADDAGQFYLMPQDTGAGSGKQVTEALKARSIGSEELSLWLRDVRAVCRHVHGQQAREGGQRGDVKGFGQAPTRAIVQQAVVAGVVVAVAHQGVVGHAPPQFVQVLLLVRIAAEVIS